MAKDLANMIDPEIRGLLPKLSSDELATLEANLKRDGCHEPLVLWGAEAILLDGYHRLEICRRDHQQRHTGGRLKHGGHHEQGKSCSSSLQLHRELLREPLKRNGMRSA